MYTFTRRSNKMEKILLQSFKLINIALNLQNIISGFSAVLKRQYNTISLHKLHKDESTSDVTGAN